MYNGLITRLNIRLKGLENDKKNMSENDVRNKKLGYLKDLVRTIVNASQKKDEKSEKSARERQQGQGLKILTLQQMITTLPILLAQLKAGNNSQKLKNELRRLLFSLHGPKNLSKVIHNHLISTI